MLTKEEFYRIFGENIREFREERNMTIKKLSIITGIRTEYLKRIELGNAKRLKASHIFIFADAFNLKPHEIVKNLWTKKMG